MDQTMNTMRQEGWIAFTLLAALQSPETPALQAKIEIEDVSKLLFKLKQAGMPLGDLALRRVPEGYYSEDVEMMLGHYIVAGLATKQSPITINEAGMHLLHEIVAEEKKTNPRLLTEAERVLGFTP